MEALAPAQPDDRIDINHPIPLAVGTAASMQAAVMDPGVRGALATPGDDPALTAYLAVTRLLASDFAWPVEDEVPRGAVVGPPIAAPLDSLVLGTFIDLLATTPTLRPVTVEEWFRIVASGPLVGEAADLAPAETADLAPLALRLAASSVEARNGLRERLNEAIAAAVLGGIPSEEIGKIFQEALARYDER